MTRYPLVYPLATKDFNTFLQSKINKDLLEITALINKIFNTCQKKVMLNVVITLYKFLG